MLTLSHIQKSYGSGDTQVLALKDVDLRFRRAEFVSVLGPSGCGKTTLLNLIGGLDRYTSGDLAVDGVSTKQFRAADWDAYRNHRVGFVFQSYNLIPHLTVLGNVELALTLSGVSPSERKARALRVLTRVGLEKYLKKRPNQLSGGQCQRVAIARALVNDPEIVLADEPTGALDSGTGEQIMELLREISRERLVITVTHNAELAQKYSDRMIRLFDGEVVSDSNPCTEEEAQKAPSEPALDKSRKAGTSMSFLTALNLSFRNLVTKKGRTFLTSFAGSIGIVGVALVLALSSGFSAYLARMQTDTLAGYPITINRTATVADLQYFLDNSPDYEAFPAGDVIYPYDENSLASDPHTNLLTREFLQYLDGLDPALATAVHRYRSVRMRVLCKRSENEYAYLSTGTSYSPMTGETYSIWQEMFDPDLVADQFDLLEGGRMPAETGEILLVVDKYNRLSQSFLKQLGIEPEEGETLSFSDFVGMEFRLVLNDAYYRFNPSEGENGIYQVNPNTTELFNGENENVILLKVVGILRQKEQTQAPILDAGFAFLPELLDFVAENAAASDASLAQLAAGEENIVVEGERNFAYQQVLQHLGLDDTPASIRIYPKDFESKRKIRAYLDAWNEGKSDADTIRYSDLAEVMTSSMGSIVQMISYVLVALAAISLVVSSLMIGIITYTSVLERTKEIGVLRSIGARKKDVSRVFLAESAVIGGIAGVLGVAIAFGLTFPLNLIIASLSGFSGIAALNPLHAVVLFAVSVALTLIAGAIPARVASRKDPVAALRSE